MAQTLGLSWAPARLKEEALGSPMSRAEKEVIRLARRAREL